VLGASLSEGECAGCNGPGPGSVSVRERPDPRAKTLSLSRRPVIGSAGRIPCVFGRRWVGISMVRIMRVHCVGRLARCSAGMATAREGNGAHLRTGRPFSGAPKWAVVEWQRIPSREKGQAGSARRFLLELRKHEDRELGVCHRLTRPSAAEVTDGATA
jgi:hypothetical protein